MPELNPKNAERWITSYFDSPHTVHIGAGALGAALTWVVGSMELAFSQPPMWVSAAMGVGVSAVTYGLDICATTLYEWYSRDE